MKTGITVDVKEEIGVYILKWNTNYRWCSLALSSQYKSLESLCEYLRFSEGHSQLATKQFNTSVNTIGKC